MSRDWTVESSHEEALRMFEGCPVVPEEGWVFNSNWMDWNLVKEGMRAHVTWDGSDCSTDWDIYVSPTATGFPAIESGRAISFQFAILSAQCTLNRLVKERTK